MGIMSRFRKNIAESKKNIEMEKSEQDINKMMKRDEGAHKKMLEENQNQREGTAEKYREMMRQSASMSYRSNEIMRNSIDEKLVNEGANKLYIKAFGCTKSDYDLLMKCEKIISNAKENGNTDNIEEAICLINQFAENNADMLRNVLEQDYQENGDKWNEAQKKVYEILAGISELKAQRKNSINNRQSPEDDAR